MSAPRPAKAREVLELVGLEDRADRPAGGLTLAERKRLELARALGDRAPAAAARRGHGGPHADRDGADRRDLVRAINARGIAILLIEHVMRAVMALSQRIVVLSYGRGDRRGRAGRDRARPARRSRPTWARHTTAPWK